MTRSNQTGILLARMSKDGFDICVVLCSGCEVRTGTSRNSIARTNQEFERYANVETLEFYHVYIANCQTEKVPMRVMNSYRLTIFLGVEAEVAGFETEPNEESMVHAQACGLIPCGCVKYLRYRQWLRRVRTCEEEYDVCSSLPHTMPAKMITDRRF